ncbi:MAG: peptide chain release factor N(5)-glutamine methyltransferase [Mariprofundales bacterium]|nr:peptide chain release factor N(5)-glutamine methyltransferase [Mariprofundales bacterium]
MRQRLFAATTRLRDAGCDSAALDARLLLQQITGLDHSGLIMQMDDLLAASQIVTFEAMVVRRCQREPLAYIVGQRAFWNHSFHTDPRALIPRPETEHLIEAVLAHFPNHDQALQFCDVATGSGCIAISLALEYPQARLVATDLSPAALALARENAELLGVAARVDLRCGDLFAPLTGEYFDAIISNPPYVAAQEMAALAPELAFEPQMALTDHDDGLTLLRRLLADAGDYLKPGGYLMVETGSCGLPQPSASIQLVEAIHDLAGLQRVGVYRLVNRNVSDCF